MRFNFARSKFKIFGGVASRVAVVLLLGPVGLAMTSCTKKNVNEGNSLIALQVPATSNQQSKNGVAALATIPVDRKACFGVSILAPDITSIPASSCSPAVGIVGGFVESGGVLQLEVPRGDNRTFELYMYLQAVGESNPCPAMGAKFSATELTRVYFMGSATASIRKAVEDITLEANFPGVTQTLAVANSYPASCTASVAIPPTPGLRIANAAGVATGGGMKLNARVGQVSGTIMTGGGMKLIAK